MGRKEQEGDERIYLGDKVGTNQTSFYYFNTIEEEGGGARRKLEAETFFTLYIIFLKNRVLSNEIRADDL